MTKRLYIPLVLAVSKNETDNTRKGYLCTAEIMLYLYCVLQCTYGGLRLAMA